MAWTAFCFAGGAAAGFIAGLALRELIWHFWPRLRWPDALPWRSELAKPVLALASLLLALAEVIEGPDQ